MSASSNIPARLDHLPWSRWHWRVVLALGIAWVLDGLEVTIVGSFGSMLERPDTLALTATQVGWAGSLYVGGTVAGALVFGRMADRLGRKKLFLITLAVYMLATMATAFSPGFAMFAVCRFLTGVGIGGEYAAINSAIDELVPARVRGRVSLAINGSFWIGAGLGAALSLVLLDTRWLAVDLGWRLGFLLGAVLSVAVLVVRRHVPESPRWLMAHGRAHEAEAIVSAIEAEVRSERPGWQPAAPADTGPQFARTALPGFRQVAWVLLHHYRQRSAVVLALMVSQAFFYNAIFFTYALVLTRFYAVEPASVGLYILPFAAGNVLGPLLLGPLFDRIGRRFMIALTYGLSGLGLLLTGLGFLHGVLDATTQTLAWSAVFFLASAAASSAYLTVSEVFPLEMRAMAIAIFFAVGAGIGGFAAPALFGALIETGSRANVFVGYAVGAALVVVAAGIAWRWGVDAEGRSLEDIAPPLGSAPQRPPPVDRPAAARWAYARSGAALTWARRARRTLFPLHERERTMEPMKPMKPMEPMKPMQPMAPMQPMQSDNGWWPEGLSNPSSTGAQNDLQYAFFQQQRRLVIRQGGAVQQYDTGELAISGVGQSQSGAGAGANPVFSTAQGEVALSSLRKVG